MDVTMNFDPMSTKAPLFVDKPSKTDSLSIKSPVFMDDRLCGWGSEEICCF